MSRTSETLRGVVHGTSIQLEHPLSVPDGAHVELTVKCSPMSLAVRQQRLEALFGSCESDTEQLDEFLSWNREQRKQNRCEVAP